MWSDFVYSTFSLAVDTRYVNNNKYLINFDLR